MSADEDTELRDLVAQTLESNGVLGKIRAQLRASVFLALEDQESVKNKTPLQNADLLKFLSTKQGLQIAGLVREFLQFFSLDFTLAVFDPELGYIDKLPERDELMRDLNLDDMHEEIFNQPLLSTICNRRDDAAGISTKLSSEHQKYATVSKSNASSSKSAIQVQSKTDITKAKFSNKPLSFEQDDDSFFDDSITRDVKGLDIKSNGHEEKMEDLAAKPISNLIAESQDDYDYEDDFQGSSISPPVDQTPRSARSDINNRHKAASLIEDEIVEELSNVDDLLKDESSLNGELTTDRTVSPTEQNDALDYMEDVLRH